MCSLQQLQMCVCECVYWVTNLKWLKFYLKLNLAMCESVAIQFQSLNSIWRLKKFFGTTAALTIEYTTTSIPTIFVQIRSKIFNKIVLRS